MSNGGLPANTTTQPQPARPTAPQIPVEYQRAFELVNSLWNDGETGSKIRAKAKEKYNITTPDDTIEPMVAPLKAEIKALQEKLAKRDEDEAKAAKEAQESSAKKTFEDSLASAREKYNLTQEAVEKLLKRMQDTNNYGDVEAAALWVIDGQPKAPAPGPSWAPKNLDLKGNLDKEMVKLLHSDPVAYQDAQLDEFTRDPDKYVRETFGTAA